MRKHGWWIKLRLYYSVIITAWCSRCTATAPLSWRCRGLHRWAHKLTLHIDCGNTDAKGTVNVFALRRLSIHLSLLLSISFDSSPVHHQLPASKFLFQSFQHCLLLYYLPETRARVELQQSMHFNNNNYVLNLGSHSLIHIYRFEIQTTFFCVGI